MQPSAPGGCPGRRMLARAAVCVVALLLTECSGRYSSSSEGRLAAASQVLSIKGSDTMVILMQRFAEAYMKKFPGTVVQVSGGGSGTGIAALVNGTTDIAAASRKIKAREEARLTEGESGSQGAHALQETRVAVDAIGVYVHARNPVTSLTLDEVKRIFRGHYHSWQEVGGTSTPFVLYSRENNSGTYEFFKAHALSDEDFAPEAQTLPGTAAVIHAVSRDPRGIGYGGIAYSSGTKAVSIEADGRLSRPSCADALEGRYPLARILHLYSIAKADTLAGKFMRWTQSEEAQKLVERVGFFPIPAAGQEVSAFEG